MRKVSLLHVTELNPVSNGYFTHSTYVNMHFELEEG